MHTYRAIVSCKEPVAPGFSCATMDVIDFDYAGEPLDVRTAQNAINEQNAKRCDRCFSCNWKVAGLSQVSEQVCIG